MLTGWEEIEPLHTWQILAFTGLRNSDLVILQGEGTQGFDLILELIVILFFYVLMELQGLHIWRIVSYTWLRNTDFVILQGWGTWGFDVKYGLIVTLCVFYIFLALLRSS